MPRYHLHQRTPELLAEDEEGLELPSPEAAKVEAIKGIRDILAAEVLKGRLPLKGQIEIVEEETGSTVAVIDFKDVVEIDA